jgi:arsenate reductase
MAIQYLEEKNTSYHVVEYLKEVPTVNELRGVLAKLGVEPEALIRKGEADFKDNFKGLKLSDDEWIEAMVKYPKLIERPIVIKGEHAVVARPTEKIDDLK